MKQFILFFREERYLHLILCHCILRMWWSIEMRWASGKFSPQSHMQRRHLEDSECGPPWRYFLGDNYLQLEMNWEEYFDFLVFLVVRAVCQRAISAVLKALRVCEKSWGTWWRQKSSRVRIRRCNEFVFVEDYVGYLQFIEIPGWVLLKLG